MLIYSLIYLVSIGAAFQVKLSHKLNINVPISIRADLPTIKLPVWPVWSGVLAQLLEWAGQNALAARLVSSVGGRVVPMELSNADLSPFLLLAHHTHSFMPLDPFREATKLFLPEGFPAHPHSGFDTVTYCLHGGLKHRDSDGIQMTYGDGDTQWMRAGRGVIHEEMWDTGDYWKFKKIEIFQLWVNLRKSSKSKVARCELIPSNSVAVYDRIGVRVKLIAGDVVIEGNENDKLAGPASSIADSDLCIAHISLAPNSKVSLVIPDHCHAAVYAREGAAVDSSGLRIGPNSLTRYSSSSSSIPSSIALMQIFLESKDDGFDCLLLLGEPLNEPVFWSGPVVEADRNDYSISMSLFNEVNAIGGFWDHKIPDEAWATHVGDLNLSKIIARIKGL